jgi:hypothetical protein
LCFCVDLNDGDGLSFVLYFGFLALPPWRRQMTMEIFMRTLLDGSVSPTISQQELEDATMRVITLLG